MTQIPNIHVQGQVRTFCGLLNICICKAGLLPSLNLKPWKDFLWVDIENLHRNATCFILMTCNKNMQMNSGHHAHCTHSSQLTKSAVVHPQAELLSFFLNSSSVVQAFYNFPDLIALHNHRRDEMSSTGIIHLGKWQLSAAMCKLPVLVGTRFVDNDTFLIPS